MYSQAPLRPSRSRSSPSTGSRAAFPAQERYAGSSTYDVNEYGQRIPSRQHPTPQSSSNPPPKSLRSAASSSRLPRRSSREMMPPPPLPQHHPSLHHAHSSSNLHPSSGRSREVDRRPSLQHLRSEPSTQTHPSARYPHELRRSPYDDHRQPANEHADILERMRQRGWSGVGGRDASPSRRSSSSSSAGEDAEPWGRSASLSKADSGYSEGEDGRSGAEGYGERVLEGWSALKKAVVGFAGDATAEGGQGAQIWKNLTATLAQSVGQVQFAWGGEDDGTIGPDGETKLGRAIKEYHLSRSNSIDDVPDWLLSSAERASHRRPAAHPIGTPASPTFAKPHSLAMKTALVLIALGLARAPALVALDPRLVTHNRRYHAVPQAARLAKRGGSYGGSSAYAGGEGGGGAYGGGEPYTSAEAWSPSYSPGSGGSYGGGSNGYGGGWDGGMGAGSLYETCMQTCYAEQGLTWDGYNNGGGGGGWETTIYEDSSGAWATTTYQGGAYETGTSQSSSAGGWMGDGYAGSGYPPSSAMSNMMGNGSMLGGASMVGGDLVAGPNQVVVAPKLGDLRMVPFNIPADTGTNLTFVWGAGPHTVTQSSALTICNASKEAGAFKSGKQQKGFQFPVQVTSQATVFYYCGVPTHCEKGMFGLINGQVANDANGTFESAMATMAANNSTFGQLMQQTQAMCQNVPEAASWGANLATSQIPEWALPVAMENILYTRQYFAMNPSLLAAANSTSTSSATTTSSAPTSDPYGSMSSGTSSLAAAATGDSPVGGVSRPALSVELVALAPFALAVLL
ncbi:hypothetical protein JCM1840_001077 [Sporobolomyces johnsonii]